MNTSQVEKALIQAGFTFSKTHDKVSEKNEWVVSDADGIPLARSHYRGELVRKLKRSIGGI
jgi:hypothetical protein